MSTFDYKKYLIPVNRKDYLPVAARLIWFRMEHPDWSIITTPVEINHEKQFAIFFASVLNAEGKVMATAHKKEDVKGFPDYMEKAETSAIGRALAVCGFGTQFCGVDLDEVQNAENPRLADAPVERPSQQRQPPALDRRPAQDHPATDSALSAITTELNPVQLARIRYAKEAEKLGHDVRTAPDPQTGNTQFSNLKINGLYVAQTRKPATEATEEDWTRAERLLASFKPGGNAQAQPAPAPQPVTPTPGAFKNTFPQPNTPSPEALADRHHSKPMDLEPDDDLGDFEDPFEEKGVKA